MMIHRAYKYELDPNNQQRTKLLQHAGTARFTYNWGLAERNRLYKETGKSPNAIEQHRILNKLKKPISPGCTRCLNAPPRRHLGTLTRLSRTFFAGSKTVKKRKAILGSRKGEFMIVFG